MDDKRPPLDLVRGLKDPATIFTEPEEILRQPFLSRDMKIELLQRWERLVRAQREMGAVRHAEGEPPLLGRVIRALNALLHDRTLDAEEGRGRRGGNRGPG